MERAMAELAERLPRPLLPLARMAYNYRWSWMPDGAALFRAVDPEVWRRNEGNPRDIIESTVPHRLAALARQPEYVKQLHTVMARIDADLRRPWAQTSIAPEHPVAYFCSEFGIHGSLPLYGGGLGVLAGDFLKAASDLAIPIVGVGRIARPSVSL